MHILWVIPRYYSFIVEEIQELEKRVGRVSVICQEAPRAMGSIHCITIPNDDINFVRVFIRLKYTINSLRNAKWPKSLLQWKSIWRIARKTEFVERYVRDAAVDVLHSHFAVPDGTACSLLKKKIPTVVSLRGVDILTVPEVGYGFCLDEFYCENLRRAVMSVDAITVASTTTRTALNNLLPNHPDNVYTIPNGVSLERFVSGTNQNAARKSLPFKINGNEQLLLAVGNLVPVKAFDDLLRAIASVVPRHRRIKLIIAGDGPERKRLEDLAEELDLCDHLLLPGKVERKEMSNYFAACDVFVHFSMSEGFGNVILEAMASAKPVVVTRTGFAADLIENGVNGFTVDVGDARAFSEKICACLDDPTRAKAVGIRARKAVREGFSLEDRADRFVRLYQKAFCRSRAREELI